MVRALRFQVSRPYRDGISGQPQVLLCLQKIFQPVI